MSWVGIGAVVGAGVSYASSEEAASAAEAGQQQAAALTQQQLAQQQQQYKNLLALSAPYREAGTQALSQYQNLIANPSVMYQDPAYQAILNQGIQAAEGSAAAGGTQFSGRTLAGLQNLGMATGAQYRQQILGELVSLANMGLSSTGQATDLGQQNISNIGSAYGNLANLAQQTGQLQAGAALGQGTAFTNLIGGLGGAYIKYNQPSQTPAGTGTLPPIASTGGGYNVPDLYSQMTGPSTFNINDFYTGATD